MLVMQHFIHYDGTILPLVNEPLNQLMSVMCKRNMWLPRVYSNGKRFTKMSVCLKMNGRMRPNICLCKSKFVIIPVLYNTYNHTHQQEVVWYENKEPPCMYTAIKQIMSVTSFSLTQCMNSWTNMCTWSNTLDYNEIDLPAYPSEFSKKTNTALGFMKH